VAVIKFRNMESGQALPVPPGEFTIGRLEDCDLQIDHPSVSRRHAKLFNSDVGMFVEDLGSANGTAMGGAFVTGRAQLKFGDVVHFGSIAMRIDPELPGEAPARPPEPKPIVLPSKTRLSRNTERIMRIAPQIPREQLAAPQVAATSADADELNAVQFREPAPAARPEETPFPIPMPKRSDSPTPSTPIPKPRIVSSPAAATTAARPAPAPVAEAPAPAATMGYVVAFSVGLAVGLALGFIIAHFLK
jgi:predicted component of type VI protein secretion system